MNQKIKILMIDDHPMIIEGYQNTLLFTKKENQVFEENSNPHVKRVLV